MPTVEDVTGAAPAAPPAPPAQQQQQLPQAPSWPTVQHEVSAAGLEGALGTWAPAVEASINRLDARLNAVAERMEAAEGRSNDLQANLTSLEARTQAAVAEGASQMDQTVQRLTQTAEHTQYVRLAAEAVTARIQEELTAVVVGARAEFTRVTQQQEQSDSILRSRTDLLGEIAGSLGNEMSRRCQEQEDNLRQLYEGTRAELARQKEVISALQLALQTNAAYAPPPTAAAAPGATASTGHSGAAAGWGSHDGPSDPWAASRPQGAVPQPPGIPPPGVTPAFRVDNRNWGDFKRLDVSGQPELYLVWRDRAIAHLAKDRPDVKALLSWSEKQAVPIDQSKEKEGASASGLVEGPGAADRISYLLYDGIKHLLADTMLGRARACGDGRGLELWRSLHVEWAGSSSHVLGVKTKKYQDPPRCSSELGLWEALPAWLKLGEELAVAGYDAPEWVKVNGLQALVPTAMVAELACNPNIKGFDAMLKWTRAKMEHARGSAVAASMAKAPAARAQDKDVNMDSVQGDGLLWELQKTMNDALEAGDQSRVAETALAIHAISKGSGKGGYGKGGAPGKGGYGQIMGRTRRCRRRKRQERRWQGKRRRQGRL